MILTFLCIYLTNNFVDSFFHLDELGKVFRPSNKLRIYFYSTCHEIYAPDRQSSPE